MPKEDKLLLSAKDEVLEASLRLTAITARRPHEPEKEATAGWSLLIAQARYSFISEQVTKREEEQK